jgi:hypothetical protein
LAGHAPIVHLQQTTGQSSEHLPFTETCNRRGIIQAERVLQSMYASYSSPVGPELPPRCAEIYLTLELFAGTADYGSAIIDRMRESVLYWRKAVPEDGLRLDELASRWL